MSKIEDSISRLSPAEFSNIDVIDYDPTGMPNSKAALDRALAENLTVVIPRPDQLFLDMDDDHSFLLFKRLFMIFQKFVDDNAEYKENFSKSGPPKRHVVVYLSRDVKDEIERVMFQAMLGSDRVREILGYVQAVNGDPHPTLFLEDDKPKALPAAPEPLQLTGEILTDDDIPF